MLEESLAIRETLDDPSNVAYSHYRLGTLFAEEGEDASAQGRFEQWLAIFHEVGDRPGIAHALHDLGVVDARQGNLASAVGLFGEALETRHVIGDRQGMAQILERLACVVDGSDTARRAVRWLAAAAAYRDANDTPLPQTERNALDQKLNELRRTLGEAAFADAWATGNAISVEDAARDALGLDR